MSTYEPGTVAIATVRGVPNVRVVRVDYSTTPEWMTLGQHPVGAIWHSGRDVTDVRPLVVLDLEDAATTVEYLKEATDGFDKAAHGMDAWIGRGPIRQVWAQIEAQTKPPRIPEPGLWGVVEAAVETHGHTRGRFVRDTADTWACLDWPGDYGWTYLVDPKLIRDGIEATS